MFTVKAIKEDSCVMFECDHVHVLKEDGLRNLVKCVTEKERENEVYDCVVKKDNENLCDDFDYVLIRNSQGYQVAAVYPKDSV